MPAFSLNGLKVDDVTRQNLLSVEQYKLVVLWHLCIVQFLFWTCVVDALKCIGGISRHYGNEVAVVCFVSCCVLRRIQRRDVSWDDGKGTAERSPAQQHDASSTCVSTCTVNTARVFGMACEVQPLPKEAMVSASQFCQPDVENRVHLIGGKKSGMTAHKVSPEKVALCPQKR